jgi:hypothetical protein
VDNGIGWFAQAAFKKVGNGNITKFWKDVWVGNRTLQSRLSRLFGISVQKDTFVGDMGRWENGGWKWDLKWRRTLFVWEEGLLQELGDLLALVSITDVNDCWVWNPGIDGDFTVKLTYVLLDNILNPRMLMSSSESFGFKFIWKSGVPSKVSALSWQLLLDRIPTRDNLRRRGVIQTEDSSCPICHEVVESANHLFLHCRYAARVWYDIMRWLGVVVVLPPTVLMSYMLLVGSGLNCLLLFGWGERLGMIVFLITLRRR